MPDPLFVQKQRDKLLGEAVSYLIKAEEIGGYIGFAADVLEVIRGIEKIRTKLNKR